jgi:iron complex outermembrane receptor protein
MPEQVRTLNPPTETRLSNINHAPQSNPLKKMHQKQLISFTALWFAISLSAAGQSGPSEIVELSPFVINASADKGYESAYTLSGTRLSTPAKYVGAASFEVTKTLMEDLGLTNMQDLINFTPNATSYAGGGITNDTTGNSALFGVQYNVRGLSVGGVSRDFLIYRAPDDGYNIEQFSFTRGPNSVLFGIGQPGGIVNSISKRAKLANAYQVSTSFDTNGSHRVTSDLNQQIIPKRVAIRLSGVSENRMTNRKPSDRIANRIYGTVTIKPIESTTVRASVEHGRLNSLVVRPWIASDGTIDWVAKGRQEIPANLANGGINYAQLEAAPSGQPSIAQNRAQLLAAGFETQQNFPVPLFTFDQSGKSPTAIINNNGFVYTGRATQSNGERLQGWVDNPPIPYTANALGYGNSLVQNIDNHTISIEQRIGKNLFLEATFNRQRVNNRNNSFSGFDDNIYLDKNRTFLAWDGKIYTNPNYNRYFQFVGNSGGYISKYRDQTARIMASYELDFKRAEQGLWRRILGHHNFALLREENRSDYIQTLFYLTNTSPTLVKVPQFTAAAAANPLSANNKTNFLNYFTPGDVRTYGAPNYWDQFPGEVIFDGMPLPAPNANGITPAFTASSSLRALTRINSQMAVMQNFFWNEKIVTTVGVRKDVFNYWNLTSLTNPATNRVIDAGKRDVKTSPTGMQEYLGNTYTQGVVVTALPWLGVFYNRSNNFVPPTGNRVNLYGSPMPSGRGTGQDYGLKIALFKGRMTGSISRYTTVYQGVVTGIFRSSTINLQVPMNLIKLVMNDPSLGGPGGEFWRGYYPWPTETLTYASLNDIDAKGYELSLTANPTPNWRLTGNFSHQRSVSSNFGALEAKWVKEVAFGYFEAHPQYLGLLTGSGPRGPNETIADRLQDMKDLLSLANSLNGKADARQPQYTANLVMGYDLTERGLKGASIGGSYQWRRKMIIGYPFVPGRVDLFQTDKPYFNDDTHNVGAYARYRFNLLKTRTTVQVNVNGLNNDNRIHPYSAVDNGKSTPTISKYAIGPGRSFALQVTFDF